MEEKNIFDKVMDCIDDNIYLAEEDINSKVNDVLSSCNADNFNILLRVISNGDVTFKEYIKKRKLAVAAEKLINEPDMTIGDISSAFNYSEQSVFARAMNNYFKCSPSDVRNGKAKVKYDKLQLNRFTSNNEYESTLERILEDLVECCGFASQADHDYFNVYWDYSKMYGFDVNTCCAISSVSDKLGIPFSVMLETSFSLMLEWEENRNKNEDSEDYYDEMM